MDLIKNINSSIPSWNLLQEKDKSFPRYSSMLILFFYAHNYFSLVFFLFFILISSGISLLVLLFSVYAKCVMFYLWYFNFHAILVEICSFASLIFFLTWLLMVLYPFMLFLIFFLLLSPIKFIGHPGFFRLYIHFFDYFTSFSIPLMAFISSWTVLSIRMICVLIFGSLIFLLS